MSLNIFLLLLFYISCVRCVTDKVNKLNKLHLFEGNSCTAEDGTNGTCIRINRCLAVPRILQDKKRPVICSFQGKIPIICCSDCNTDIDISNIVMNNHGGHFWKNGQKSYDKCLEFMVSLPYACPLHSLTRRWSQQRKCYEYGDFEIYTTFNGMNALRGEYPHMALLGYGADLESVQWLCGGSVISERYILTAAHCISSPNFGPVTYVALGILKRTDKAELWQRYRVNKIIPHPEYKSPSKYHDIALLQTDKKIQFSGAVLPACLNSGEVFEYTAQAIGWGALGPNQELADTLQTVELLRYSENQCKEHYPVHRHLTKGYNHTTQMCYGDTLKDTCKGDSGGPLQVTSEFGNCVYLVIGITSYGRSCGYAGSSGMYTKVSYYVPWIESVVWP